MAEIPSMDRTRVEVSTLQMQGADSAVTHMTSAECLAMVWQLNQRHQTGRSSSGSTSTETLMVCWPPPTKTPRMGQTSS